MKGTVIAAEKWKGREAKDDVGEGGWPWTAGCSNLLSEPFRGLCVKCRCRRSRCGAGVRLCLSNRCPVMRMLLAGDHALSGRAVPVCQLQSFYSESIGIANGLSDKMSVSKFPSCGSCVEGGRDGASVTLGESRTVVKPSARGGGTELLKRTYLLRAHSSLSSK